MYEMNPYNLYDGLLINKRFQRKRRRCRDA